MDGTYVGSPGNGVKYKYFAELGLFTIEPMLWRVNPDEETIDWRAVCGRTARTVRREGRSKGLSYPYTSLSTENEVHTKNTSPMRFFMR